MTRRMELERALLAEVDASRLARFLAREASPEDAAAIDAWIDGDAERRSIIAEYQAMWDRPAVLADLVAPVDVASAWRRLATRLRAAPDTRRIERRLPARTIGGAFAPGRWRGLRA